MSYSSDDEDAMRRYLPKFSALARALPQLERMLPKVAALPWEKRGNWVVYVGNAEEVYIGIMRRPALPFINEEGIDELAVLTRALRLGWALWPDCWTGLQVVLDVLAEKTSKADIVRIAQDDTSLQTLKAIAQTTVRARPPARPGGAWTQAGEAAVLWPWI